MYKNLKKVKARYFIAEKLEIIANILWNDGIIQKTLSNAPRSFGDVKKSPSIPAAIPMKQL